MGLREYGRKNDSTSENEGVEDQEFGAYDDATDEGQDQRPEEKKKMSVQMMAVVGLATVLFVGFMVMKFSSKDGNIQQEQSQQAFLVSHQVEARPQQQAPVYQPTVAMDATPQVDAKIEATEKIEASKDRETIEALLKQITALEEEVTKLKMEKAKQIQVPVKQQKPSAATTNTWQHQKAQRDQETQEKPKAAPSKADMEPEKQVSANEKLSTSAAAITPITKSTDGMKIYAIKDGRAWIKIPSGDIVFISNGDTLPGGAKITSIGSDKVTTSDGTIE